MYSPLLLTGVTTQRQWLEISYFTEFYNDPGNMAATITISIQSQFIQVTTFAKVHAVPIEGEGHSKGPSLGTIKLREGSLKALMSTFISTQNFLRSTPHDCTSKPS